MIKKDKILLLRQKVYKIVFLLIMLLPAFKGKAQGLSFNSNDSLLSKRTSYEVFKPDLPTFHHRLLIQFDLALWDNENLGYVFNITDKKNNSYSLSYIHADSTSYLNFNIDSKSNKIKIPLDFSQLNKRNWMKVKVNLDLTADKVEILINGKFYRAGRFGFKNEITPKITFGKNAHYNEVPNMAIRNLTVGDDSRNYFFPLNEWKGKNVYSHTGDITGAVENPVWLINESYFWTLRFRRSFNEVAGLNFDEKKQRIFIFNSDSLIFYHTQLDYTSVQACQNKCPVPFLLGKSIVNSKENKCYVYEVNRTTKQSPNVATLDLNTYKWDIAGNATLKTQRHHHNIFYNKNQDTFYLFGGYGSFSYYNNFFVFNKRADSWQNVPFTGDTITPRFFSGYTKANDKNEVYIFGGYGNKSGSQIIGGKNLYDLYRVNLTNHTVKKCWEINHQGEDFVPANNMILSKDKAYFYTLCYAHAKPKTTLRLYKFSIKDGSYQIVSGVIPVISERIETDINLFFDPKLNEFFCAVQEFSNVSHSVIKIYSLSSPPVSQQDYIGSSEKRAGIKNIYKYMALLLFLLTAGMIWIIIQGIKKKKSLEIVLPDGDNLSGPLYDKKEEDEKMANAVYLLGEFTVYDKNQRDISYLFSPKIKQLFVLILLNSKNETGVVSKKISTTLWPEKDVAKTKNIKGVTINHLRNIIADIDGIDLTFLNDTYCFKLSPDFFCDYIVVMNRISEINKGEVQPSILHHFELISRGGLLQSTPEAWLDDFKLFYEEALMPAILPQAKRGYDGGDFRRTLEITRVVLNIDPFNEEAIKYKLKALRRIRGIEYAHSVYNEFIIEYKKSLGVDYTVYFGDICSDRADQ